MQHCIYCGQELKCHCGGGKPFSGAVMPCGLKMGALWIHVTDDTGERISDFPVSCAGKAEKTDGNGVAKFDPLDAKVYTAALGDLPQRLGKLYVLPDLVNRTRDVTVASGELAYVPFVVPRAPGTLVVTVVDSETGKPVMDTAFPIAVTGQQTQPTGNQGVARFTLAPLAYSRVALDITDPQMALVYIPGDDGKATVLSGEEAPVNLKVTVRKLRLIAVDKIFAPSLETLDIEYEIRNLKTEKVVLRILDANQDPVFERELTDEEKTNSDSRKILWGKEASDRGNVPQHALHQKFLNPLYGPYTVVLHHSAPLQGQATFDVLYHSLELDLMKWEDLYKAAAKKGDTTKPDGSDKAVERMWLQYKLNDMGFWAGPVDGANTEELAKAIRCLRLAHPQLNTWSTGVPFYAVSGEEMVYNATTDPTKLKAIDSKLTDILDAGDTKAKFGRVSLSDPKAASDPSKSSKILLDNHRFFFSQSSEFEDAPEQAPTRKFNLEREWLNRPTLPFRAKLLLVKKDKSAGDAPLATGPAPLLWKWRGFDEDQLRRDVPAIAPELPARKPKEPSGVAAFLGQSHRGIWNSHPGPYQHQGTTVDAGGILTGTQATDAVAAFSECRMMDGAAYTAVTEGVVARSFTGDPARTAFGSSSVVYLRPSLIAGDNYQVSVSLHLDAENGRTGHDKRVQNHAPRDAGLKKQSGRMVLWRRIAVAGYVGWPVRRNWADALAPAKKEFEPCFVEVDTTSIDQGGTTFPIDQVFLKDDLAQILEAAHQTQKRQDSKGPGFPAALRRRLLGKPSDTTFDPEGVYPGDVELLEPEQEFDEFFLRMCRLHTSRANNIRDKLEKGFVLNSGPKDGVTDSLNFLMGLLDDWKDNAPSATVKNASAAIRAEVVKWLEADAGKWKVKDALDQSMFDSANLSVVAKSKLRAEHIESLLNPKRFKDEVRAYASASGAMPSAAFSTEWQKWVAQGVFASQVGDPRPMEIEASRPLEYYFADIWMATAQKILKGGFIAAMAPKFRADILDIRQWVIRRAVGTLPDLIKYPFSQQVDKAMRKKLALAGKRTDGLVLIDYNTAVPKDINGTMFTVDGAAFGGLNGVVMLDQGLITQFYSLLVHEIAHCTFLHHWKNTHPSIVENHDTNDDNCLMSYPFPFVERDWTRPNAESYLTGRFPKDVLSPAKHYSWDVFKPHFCGKCNLQLRGWNIRATGVPPSAPVEFLPVSKPPVVHVPVVRILTPSGIVADSTNKGLSATKAIGISGYPADLAGAQTQPYKQFTFGALAALPSGFGDNADAEKDPSVFRIEVEDEDCTQSSVKVMIEALKPVYSGTRATGVTEFPPEERAKRCLVDVECEQVSAHVYRSRYIRLVTDEVDRIALAGTKQGLLVTDAADGLGGENDLLEILDQQVKVTYDPTPV